MAGLPVGTNSANYAIPPADAGLIPSCTVTATNPGGSVSATSANAAAVLTSIYAFTLYNESNSPTITDFPAMRVSIDNGAWQTLAAASLTISQSANGVLTVAGFGGGVTSARFHVEREQPGEPFNANNSVDAIYARPTAGPAPQNTDIPGWPLSDTAHATPVVVTR